MPGWKWYRLGNCMCGERLKGERERTILIQSGVLAWKEFSNIIYVHYAGNHVKQWWSCGQEIPFSSRPAGSLHLFTH